MSNSTKTMLIIFMCSFYIRFSEIFVVLSLLSPTILDHDKIE